MRNFTLSMVVALGAALSGIANAAPATFTDLGNIGSAGTFSFDTVNSITSNDGGLTAFQTDTEIGLWNEAGTLLASDDDGLGFPYSIITEALTDGVYFIGISEFNSVFDDGFVNLGTAFEVGEIALLVLNIDGVFVGETFIVGGSADATLDTAFFRIEIGNVAAVPLPAALPLFLAGVGAIGVARRRKKVA